MASALYWLQTIGAAFSVLLTGGMLLAAFYSTVREAPPFVRSLLGTRQLERRFDQLHEDHVVAQELAKQQAEEFNKLAEIVAREHSVAPEEQPFINPQKINELLLRDDHPDFTRGPGDVPPGDD